MKKIIYFSLLFIFCGIINVSAATTYKVNYVLSGGTNNKKNIVEYSSLKENFVLLSPSRAGYTFDGWYTDKALTKKVESIPKGSIGNKTYYAKWIVNTYTIKYSGNGATSGTMPRRTNLRYDKNYILNANAFMKKGYKFVSWNTNAYGTGKKYLDKATVGQVSKVNGGVVTLYAQWEIVNYGITYNLNGGTNNKNNPTTYTINDEVVYKNPSKTGYTFDGWYSDKELTKKVTGIVKGNTGNKSLYAKWIVNTYTIKYSGNGAESGSMPRRTNLRYDKNYILNENTFKRTGYKFNGWNTNANGTGKTYADKATVGQVSKVNGGVVILYAKWKIVNYAINYNLAGGENNPNNPSTYNIESVITLKNPTRKGYKFGGWYSDSTFKNKVTKIENSVGVKNLYAKWTIINYTITYVTYNAYNHSTNLEEYNVESEFVLHDINKADCIFQGWYTEESFTNKITKISKGTTGDLSLYAKWSPKTPVRGEDFELDNTTPGVIKIIFSNDGSTYLNAYRSNSIDFNYEVLSSSTSNSIIYDEDVVKGKQYYYIFQYVISQLNPYLYIQGGYSSPANVIAISSTLSFEEKALAKAKMYLQLFAYSRDEIIRLLREDGFTSSEATYAADNSGVDWHQQTLKRAKRESKRSIFSRQEMINKLVSYGFTTTDAIYAADNCGADWKENAWQYALGAKNFRTVSKQTIINELNEREFTEEEIAYGINNSGVDWKANATYMARSHGLMYTLSKAKTVEYLENDMLFTHEEAVYAVNNCEVDWNEQAKTRLKSVTGNSKPETIRIMMEEYGFTYDETLYAIERLEIRWELYAMSRATKFYNSGYKNRERVIELLLDLGYTIDEATYGVDNCNVNWE